MGTSLANKAAEENRFAADANSTGNSPPIAGTDNSISGAFQKRRANRKTHLNSVTTEEFIGAAARKLA